MSAMYTKSAFIVCFLLSAFSNALPQGGDTVLSPSQISADTVTINAPPGPQSTVPITGPIDKNASYPILQLPASITEWTSMGDSYAAGIGVGSRLDTVKFYPCFRYDGSYGNILQNNLLPKPGTFNFPACSGDTTNKILNNQFNPHSTFSTRAGGWGNMPTVVTISLGGNDIGFKELVTRCVYGIPFFTAGKTCQNVIDASMNKVTDPGFIPNGVLAVLDRAFQLAQQRKIPGFRMYVLGYAQFFNQQTTQCNDVQGLPAPRFLALSKASNLTISVRTQLNTIALQLNARIQDAVNAYAQRVGTQVTYVPIDDLFEGHRFCDGPEPNPTNPNTWFITYGWNDDNNSPNNIQAAVNAVPEAFQYTDDGNDGTDFNSTDFFDLLETRLNGSTDATVQSGFTDYVDVFHPTGAGHAAIEQRLKGLIQPIGGGVLGD